MGPGEGLAWFLPGGQSLLVHPRNKKQGDTSPLLLLLLHMCGASALYSMIHMNGLTPLPTNITDRLYVISISIEETEAQRG